MESEPARLIPLPDAGLRLFGGGQRGSRAQVAECHAGSAGEGGKPQTGTDAYAANSSPSARKKAIDRENVLSIGMVFTGTGSGLRERQNHTR